MTDSERFVMVMNILNENGLGSSGIYDIMFKKLSDEELTDNNKVQDILKIISEYEERCDNPTSKYPEHIMRYLRQVRGFDEFDTSIDKEINKCTPNEAFSDICVWNGLLGGYDAIIKDWIKDIYNIDLDP